MHHLAHAFQSMYCYSLFYIILQLESVRSNWVKLTCYPIHVPICKVIYEKSIAKIENVTTSPFLRSEQTKFWEKMYTATNIGKGNDATNISPIRLFLRWNLV